MSIPAAQLADPDYIDSVFQRDRFVFEQGSILRMNTTDISDETGLPLLFAERKSAKGRGLLAIVLAVAAFFVVGIPVLLALLIIGFALFGEDPPGWVFLIALGVTALAGVAASAVALILRSPLCRIHVYTDSSRRTEVLRIRQIDRWRLLRPRYEVLTVDSVVVSWIDFRPLSLRFRWSVTPADEGETLFLERVIERGTFLREIIDGLLDRGPYGFLALRTPDGTTVREIVGVKQPTPLHVLDMSADAERLVDRRIALALGIALLLSGRM